MGKLMNNNDINVIASYEIVSLTGNEDIFNQVKNAMNKEGDKKFKTISKIISNSEDYYKSIASIYNYVKVLCEICNQGVETPASVNRREVKNIEDLERLKSSLAYDRREEKWRGPDSADLYDAEENYKLAKKTLNTI